jgi:SOS-response transcriptional repressor LexA
MVRDVDKDKLREREKGIAQFYHDHGRMPSFSEIGELTGLRSKNAVSKLVRKLEDLQVLERDRTGRLVPGSIAFGAGARHGGGRLPEPCRGRAGGYALP